ncbi:MAG: response regulator [bacterium]
MPPTQTVEHDTLPGMRDNSGISRDELSEDSPTVKGKVLFMDDEKLMRAVAVRMLKALEFQTVCAMNGEEAIELFKRANESHEPFDVVVMDLNISGGMGGQETIIKLRQIDPTVKAIISSGEAFHPVLADYRKYGFSDVLPKPYNIVELNKVIVENTEKEDVFQISH